MEIDSSIAVAAVIKELDIVKGRKRLQKIIHLLKTKGHSEFKQGFILHYFGPFSHRLASQLDFLIGDNLISEDHDPEKGYVYSIKDSEAEDRLNGLCSDWIDDSDWKDFAIVLNGEHVDFLEAVSTLAYIYNCNNSFQGDDLKNEFVRIKPHLKGRYKEALEFADDNSLLHTKS